MLSSRPTDLPVRDGHLVHPDRPVLPVRPERVGLPGRVGHPVLHLQQMQHDLFDTCIATVYAYFYEGVSERIRGRKTSEGRPGNGKPLGETGSDKRRDQTAQHPPVAYSTRSLR